MTRQTSRRFPNISKRSKREHDKKKDMTRIYSSVRLESIAPLHRSRAYQCGLSSGRVATNMVYRIPNLPMKASLLYRISSVLLILFALGHTLGFRRVDPRWGVDSIIGALRSTHFDVQGLNRTYWDFYTGFGLFVTVLLVFIAILSWQLGGLPKESLLAMPVVTWGLAACFVVVTFLSWKYFFMVPIIFSGVITICLIFAAWIAQRP